MIDKDVLSKLTELGRINNESPIYEFFELLLILEQFSPEEQEIALEILDKLYIAYKTVGTYYVYETDLVGVDKKVRIADKTVVLFVAEQSKSDVLNKLFELGFVSKAVSNQELYYISPKAFPLVSPHYMRDTLFVSGRHLADFSQEINLQLRAFSVVTDDAILELVNDDKFADSEILGNGITLGDMRKIINNVRHFEELNAAKETVEIDKTV